MVAELELLDSPRILAGTRADIEVTVYRDGTPTAPTGTGSITVNDALGIEVASGTWENTGGGLLRFTLTAVQTASVNRLTATWSGIVFDGEPAISVTTRHEVVGDQLFSETEARAYDGGKLADSTTYPDLTIQRARDRIADAFAHVLGFNVGRRFGLEVVDGAGGSELWLSEAYHLQTLRSVATRAAGSATWTPFTAGELADVLAYPHGLLVRETMGGWPAGRRNIRVAYEAGKGVPLELRQAGLRVLRDQLVGSNIPDRALRQNDELGSFDLVIAGGSFGKWFGIPPVDAVLQRYRERVPAAY